jgi:hypothetical protein
MESILFTDEAPSALLLIAGAVVIIPLCMAISGCSMRWANQVCGGPDAGFLRSLLAAIACTFSGTAAATGAVALSNDGSPWTPLVYGVVGSAIGIAVVLPQNPFRAVCTHLVFSIFSFLFSFTTFLILVAMVYFCVPETTVRQLADELAMNRSKAPLEATAFHDEVRQLIKAKYDDTVASGQMPFASGQMPVVPVPEKLPRGVSKNPFVP